MDQPEPQQAPEQTSSPDSAAPEKTYDVLMWHGRVPVHQCRKCSYDTQHEDLILHHAAVGCEQHWEEMEEAANREARSTDE